MEENQITEKIIGSSIEIHRQLGPGLLESAYQECLYYELTQAGFYELTQAGLYVQKEKPMPVVYKEVKLDHGYRLDLLVENKVVVELKTIEAFTSVHTAQILTYMKLGNYKLGLLINFHVALLKQGIKRFRND